MDEVVNNETESVSFESYVGNILSIQVGPKTLQQWTDEFQVDIQPGYQFQEITKKLAEIANKIQICNSHLNAYKTGLYVLGQDEAKAIAELAAKSTGTGSRRASTQNKVTLNSQFLDAKTIGNVISGFFERELEKLYKIERIANTYATLIMAEAKVNTYFQ